MCEACVARCEGRLKPWDEGFLWTAEEEDAARCIMCCGRGTVTEIAAGGGLPLRHSIALIGGGCGECGPPAVPPPARRWREA